MKTFIKLSPYSKIFCYEWKINPSRSDYNVVLDEVLFGELNVLQLKHAFQRFTKDYVLLHSKIIEKSNQYYWLEDESIQIDFQYCANPLSKQELLDYVYQSFDLEQGKLTRALLVKLQRREFRFILVVHHLLIDAIKFDSWIDEISNYYNDKSYKTETSLEEQRHLLAKLTNDLEKKLNYGAKENQKFWQNTLKGIEAVEADFLKSSVQKNRAVAEYRFSFSKKFYKSIKDIKSQYRITPYLLGQVVFAILLYRYTGKTKIPTSYSLAIREGSPFVYGTHVNTNIIVYGFDSSTTIYNLLEQARLHFKSVKNGKHYYYLIGDIISSAGSAELINLNFSQTQVNHKKLSLSGINKVQLNYELKVDLSMELMVGQEVKNDQIDYYFRYNKGQVDQELLLLFVKNYRKLFRAIVNDLLEKKSETLISDYKIISSYEYQQLVYNWNQNDIEKTSADTLHGIFEQQVEKTPDNVALVYENTKMTYSELDKKANQLANYLKRDYSIHRNQLVSLYLDKNIYVPVVILGLLKAGCAYVPIDPGYADKRTHYIVNDARSILLITNKKYEKKLTGLFQETALLAIDDPIVQEEIANQSDSITCAGTKASDLLYVIYTSGTTGKPKGVLQTHHNVVQLFLSTNQYYVFKPSDVWIFFHSYAFDFSVWEVWGALLYGAKLIIPTYKQAMDFHLLYKLCYQQKVTIFNQTPKAFYQFANIAIDQSKAEKLKNLRYVILGGDTLVIKNLKNWFKIYRNSETRVVNMYGSTETTVHATYREITEFDNTDLSLIGKGIPGKKLFVLDKAMMPLPVGAIGELYIGGEGVALGYLKQPDLTKEKFVKNPFQSRLEKKQNKNSTLYKTGDLVRWLPDGSLAYMGRNDDQVKIRGYRIELGEIEAKLLEYSGIRQALVIEKKSKNSQDGNYLIAYYVARQAVTDDVLIEYLGLHLPAYMIPRFFIYLKELPLTAHGKLDKSALPIPDSASQISYEPPRNDKEKKVVSAFEKILLHKRVGITDDFFALGGDSLKAISLVSTLQDSFRVTVADIFRLRTPKSLALNMPSSTNFLYQHLERVKRNYQNMPLFSDNILYRAKVNEYLRETQENKFSLNQKKSIKNVLLTGATGYLGAYLLSTLLTTTKYTIYLIIRGDSDKIALNRLRDKYQYYFKCDLDKFSGSRLHVFKGDLSKEQLGLSQGNYNKLASKVDSVIHAAALVKHYGETDKFYYANVQATRNLLEFTKITEAKDFHYISTISILKEQELYSKIFACYTEEEQQATSYQGDNLYIKTKLEGEQIVIQYRNHRVNSNIYRLGNLAFATDGSVQENSDENSFFNKVKCFLALGLIPPELAKIEISPVDTTANAIIRLFDCQQLVNSNFHIFNPYLFDLTNFFDYFKNSGVKVCNMDYFIEVIIDYLGRQIHRPLIERFLLHIGWLNEKCHPMIQTNVLQDRTQALLKLLGVEWTPVTYQLFKQYLSNFNTASKLITSHPAPMAESS